jgi:hypothetical protein
MGYRAIHLFSFGTGAQRPLVGFRIFGTKGEIYSRRKAAE